MKAVIVDERISDACKRGLEMRGFMPILLPKDPSLGEAVASHPDTVLFKLLDELFTTCDYCDAAEYVFTDVREFAPHIKMNFTADVRGPRYPDDCKMNAVCFGKRIFARLDSLSPAIKSAADRLGYELINVNQGYPACTTLALGDSNAVTADRGMAKILSENGITVTLIGEGHISLPPHEYGFIGGAAGVFVGKVYFFGDISTHPDFEIIENAIRIAGFEPVSLSREPLRDLGGMIFL